MTLVFTAAAAIPSYACTTIYVGANLTREKTPFVARTEDYGSDMNKLWMISESGHFKKGDKWVGCPAYGAFEWTFTHDSYRFTHFTNDVFNGACPECGTVNPKHWSYTEFGTNEKGVSVSATETIYGNQKVKRVDPNVQEKVDGVVGIEETDLPTILLAEAGSAREGVDLLARIYDNYGAYFDSGLFICDKHEVWYIENCSGKQYLGIRLNDDLLFLEPNISILGEIDLDDRDNVIASAKLIETAKAAGSFVGNEAENIINYRASYALLERQKSPSQPVTKMVGVPRMTDGLTFLNGNVHYTADDLAADNTIFTISNVRDGNIVPMYTNIKADRKLTKDDVFNFYKLSSVGKPSNQEIEIFQLFHNPSLPVKYSTVGWVGVGNMSSNVFVPCYPMLMNSMYKGYQVSTAVVSKSDTKPETFGTWDPKSSRYVVYPENWRDSYYFTFEGLGGYMQYAEQIDGRPVSEEDRQYVNGRLNQLQQQIYKDFVSVRKLKAAGSRGERRLATENCRSMAEKSHRLGLELIDYLKSRP